MIKFCISPSVQLFNESPQENVKRDIDHDNHDAALTLMPLTKPSPDISNELLDNTKTNVEKSDGRPWYFSNGDKYPNVARVNKKTNRRIAKLFPHEDRRDRITNQLMFVPPNYEEIQTSGKLKTILLYNGLGTWNVKAGRSLFLQSKCPVDTCSITPNRENAKTADLILYKDHYIPTGKRPILLLMINKTTIPFLFFLYYRNIKTRQTTLYVVFFGMSISHTAHKIS